MSIEKTYKYICVQNKIAIVSWGMLFISPTRSLSLGHNNTADKLAQYFRIRARNDDVINFYCWLERTAQSTARQSTTTTVSTTNSQSFWLYFYLYNCYKCSCSFAVFFSIFSVFSIGFFVISFPLFYLSSLVCANFLVGL